MTGRRCLDATRWTALTFRIMSFKSRLYVLKERTQDEVRTNLTPSSQTHQTPRRVHTAGSEPMSCAARTTIEGHRTHSRAFRARRTPFSCGSRDIWAFGYAVAARRPEYQQMRTLNSVGSRLDVVGERSPNRWFGEVWTVIGGDFSMVRS